MPDSLNCGVSISQKTPFRCCVLDAAPPNLGGESEQWAVCARRKREEAGATFEVRRENGPRNPFPYRVDRAHSDTPCARAPPLAVLIVSARLAWTKGRVRPTREVQVAGGGRCPPVGGGRVPVGGGRVWCEERAVLHAPVPAVRRRA